MSYLVELRRVVRQQLDAIGKQNYQAIAEVISSLESIPRPPRVKKLVGSDFWRIRVGKYRIIYSINDEEKLIVITRVVKRDEGTYRGL